MVRGFRDGIFFGVYARGERQVYSSVVVHPIGEVKRRRARLKLRWGTRSVIVSQGVDYRKDAGVSAWVGVSAQRCGKKTGFK